MDHCILWKIICIDFHGTVQLDHDSSFKSSFCLPLPVTISIPVVLLNFSMFFENNQKRWKILKNNNCMIVNPRGQPQSRLVVITIFTQSVRKSVLMSIPKLQNQATITAGQWWLLSCKSYFWKLKTIRVLCVITNNYQFFPLWQVANSNLLWSMTGIGGSYFW